MSDDFKRLPPWLVQKVRLSKVHSLKKSLRGRGLHTVCESARCPNLGRCFAKPTATFLIMGDRCTRGCAFCAIDYSKPLPLDPKEPEKVADLAAELKLKHVVITSVTRDDLPDGGAGHFVKCCEKVRERLPEATCEVLTPDFQGSADSFDILAKAPIEVFNHNLETVPRLYKAVRPGADYQRSLCVLQAMKQRMPEVVAKSGLMVGLGETFDEVRTVFEDLVKHDVEAVTVGQYLRPTRKNTSVVEYIHPDDFAKLAESAKQAGLKYVACEPLVRSSYNADQMMQQIRKGRN